MNSIPAGILDKSTELFTIVIDGKKEPMGMRNGKKFNFEHMPASVKKILLDGMHSKPAVEKRIEAMAGTDADNKLRQFINCRYGFLNTRPDIDEDGKLSEPEYVQCDLRGKCPHEGFVCCSVMVSDGIFLSKAETSVFKLVSFPDKIIADMLCLSVETVKKHFQNIRLKTGLNNKIEMAVWATQKGIL